MYSSRPLRKPLDSRATVVLSVPGLGRAASCGGGTPSAPRERSRAPRASGSTGPAPGGRQVPGSAPAAPQTPRCPL
eukprot:7846906-Pyramimonas_sp.AAC.1